MLNLILIKRTREESIIDGIKFTLNKAKKSILEIKHWKILINK